MTPLSVLVTLSVAGPPADAEPPLPARPDPVPATWILVDGGEWMIGDHGDDPAEANRRPAWSVRSAPFELLSTNLLFGMLPASWPGADPHRPNDQVTGLRFDEAQRACATLDARLPTEVELEVAAQQEAGGRALRLETDPRLRASARRGGHGRWWRWPALRWWADSPCTADFAARAAGDAVDADPSCRVVRGTSFRSAAQTRWTQGAAFGVDDIGVRCVRGAAPLH